MTCALECANVFTLIQMKIKANDHDALNAVFAEKVAGMKRTQNCPCGEDCGSWKSADGTIDFLPDFTRSADAVLPWLEKQHHWRSWHASRSDSGGVTVLYSFLATNDINELVKSAQGYATTLPHAAVIALLRAHGVQVED